MQRVAKVTSADVTRIVRRDFAISDQHAAFTLLDRVRHWQGRPQPRVHAAALKVSYGDLTKLQYWVDRANLDPRDVLSAAEYPLLFTRSGDQLSDTERESIYDADWEQYQRWFTRDSSSESSS